VVSGEAVRSALSRTAFVFWKTMSAKSNGETAHSGSLAWPTCGHSLSTSMRHREGADGAPIIALTHNPMFFRIFRRACRCCCSHTHGGQVNLPLIGRPIVPSHFANATRLGISSENGHHLFVTTGIGTSILPIRFRVPPEIVSSR